MPRGPATRGQGAGQRPAPHGPKDTAQRGNKPVPPTRRAGASGGGTPSVPPAPRGRTQGPQREPEVPRKSRRRGGTPRCPTRAPQDMWGLRPGSRGGNRRSHQRPATKPRGHGGNETSHGQAADEGGTHVSTTRLVRSHGGLTARGGNKRVPQAPSAAQRGERIVPRHRGQRVRGRKVIPIDIPTSKVVATMRASIRISLLPKTC